MDALSMLNDLYWEYAVQIDKDRSEVIKVWEKALEKSMEM